ncbi:MAG: PhnD/SsuA/transferrin family substrate-binding protein, partial [Lactobacillus sp.]|nr:PhnD/SsuA/transferrin family substrate-binding protein [Lactobacillus sp.]
MSHSSSHKSKFTILFMSFLVLIGSFIGFIAPAHPVKAASNTLTVVFIPNDSVKEVEPAREALTKAISKATGKKVQIQTTTDYNIA